MGVRLQSKDDYLRQAGPEPNWNESRYVDFFDPASGLGGWFRLGNRVNEGRAELSACLYLPDGSAAVKFGRISITTNSDTLDGWSWEIAKPFEEARLRFSDTLSILRDPLTLSNPKLAFADAPQIGCEVELSLHGLGLGSVLGFDQDHIDQIFLPGQAHGHYQHLVRVTGAVKLGDQTIQINGAGSQDHSWGPRNWLSKIYFRWLIAAHSDGSGFMATRAVGPTAQKRGGFVWEDGQFHLLDYVDVESDYTDAFYPKTSRAILKSGDKLWTMRGEVLNPLPLRHRQTAPDGTTSTLRIVKSPVKWSWDDGRSAFGSGEYHDLIIDGKPAGLGI